ncbi:hypothetical protein ID866_8533 [Astraeus odoratus]|nr:hypothetical protein ID866_8533 [Astraeus odoratus]
MSPPRPPPTKRKLPAKEEINSDDDERSESVEDRPDDDTPILSHAEQRRQKKRELKAAKVVEATEKKRKLNDGSAVKATTGSKHAAVTEPAKSKRQNSVWVGNLSFKTTRDALKQFFDGIGEITRIHMPQKPGSGDNLGFAYVDFATSDAKIAAITLSEGRLDGRSLLIKDGNDFTGRPSKTSENNANNGTLASSTTSGTSTGLTKTAQKILRMQKQSAAPTLFLGNLGFDVTEDTIRELFEAHAHFGKTDKKGKGRDTEDPKDSGQDVGIRKIRMGTFEDSGKCKGFAFVDFTSVEYATNALVNPRNHRLNGRDLVVEYASAEAVRRGGGTSKDSKQGHQCKMNRDQKPKEPKATRSPAKNGTREAEGDHRDDTKVEITTELIITPHPERRKRTVDDHSRQKRARPGAALAQAPRQSAAIVPSQGQKIVF